MDLSRFRQLTELAAPEKAVPALEELRIPEKGWIGRKARECALEDFRLQKDEPRYTVKAGGVPFECLYLPGQGDRLYVMLSGGGAKTRRYPAFLRWKYKKYLDGHMLLIDDPMYVLHPGITHVMWYYGTSEQSYLELLVSIVKKAMEQLSIPASNVTFVGSSGGGYAALYAANLLDHSAAIAINPQLVLRRWQYPAVYNNFKKWGIDLAEDDPSGRNRICLTNKTCLFFICIAYKSQADYDIQFREFTESHGIPRRFGVARQGNVLTWVHDASYSEMHTVMPEKFGIMFMDYLLREVRSGADVGDAYGPSLVFNEILRERYEAKMELQEQKAVNIEARLYQAQLRALLSGEARKALETQFPEASIEEEERGENGLNLYLNGQKNSYYQVLLQQGNSYFRFIIGDIDLLPEKRAELVKATVKARAKSGNGTWKENGKRRVFFVRLSFEQAFREIEQVIMQTRELVRE